jgi:hypothetical protein
VPVPATAAVGAHTTLDEVKRASRARWRFAAFVIAANLVAVVGAVMYFRGEIAYEAMIRKAAEVKVAKLQQERDHAAALTGELATIHRDADTTVAPVEQGGRRGGGAKKCRRNQGGGTDAETRSRRRAGEPRPPTAAPVAAPPARSRDPPQPMSASRPKRRSDARRQ